MKIDDNIVVGIVFIIVSICLTIYEALDLILKFLGKDNIVLIKALNIIESITQNNIEESDDAKE